MESVSKIRRWILVEGRSIRSVARATGLSRNTIKKYLKDESPPSYQRQALPVRHKLCNGFDLRLSVTEHGTIRKCTDAELIAQIQGLADQLFTETLERKPTPQRSKKIQWLNRIDGACSRRLMHLDEPAPDEAAYWVNNLEALGRFMETEQIQDAEMAHTPQQWFATVKEHYGGLENFTDGYTLFHVSRQCQGYLKERMRTIAELVEHLESATTEEDVAARIATLEKWLQDTASEAHEIMEIHTQVQARMKELEETKWTSKSST